MGKRNVKNRVKLHSSVKKFQAFKHRPQDTKYERGKVIMESWLSKSSCPVEEKLLTWISS